jgi:hypothetical protein
MFDQRLRRAPFSDWRAQVERRFYSRTGEQLNRTQVMTDAPFTGAYHCGMSACTFADDLVQEYRR